MIILLVLCFIILYVIHSWIYFIRDSRKCNIPGPTPFPVIGNGNLFLVDSNKFLKVLSELAVKFGDAYRIYIMSNKYIVLSHPKHIEQLMTSSETIKKGYSYKFLRAWLGDGLLTSTGYKWRSHRKFLTPAFHYNILQSFLPVFLKNEKILCGHLLERADGSSPIELFPIITLTALDNITESIMGLSFHTQKDRESDYVKAINVASQIMSDRMRNLFLANEIFFSFTPQKRMQDKAVEYMHKHTINVIETRKRELQNANTAKLTEESDIGMKNKHAFLDLLLLAEVDGKGITNEDIRDEVETFMFEGHDTTASGIVFSLYCIAKHPEVQRKVLEEQMEILGDDLERDPCYNDFQKMKYLECVIKESLRIYPSVPLIQRYITEDVEMSGIHLSKDSTVMINIYHLHRNPDVFEDPLEFRPERFDGSSHLKSPFSWIAFAAGPRNCIGQKFAMLELKVTVAAVVKRFKLLPPDDEPEPCGDLILRARNGVNVKLLPRNKTWKPNN